MLFTLRVTEEDLTIMTKLAEGHFEKVIILKQLPRSTLLVFRCGYITMGQILENFKDFHSQPIGHQFWTFFCSAISGIHGHIKHSIYHESQSVDGGKLPADSSVPVACT
ncbi:unnamed protein product [Pocillopora meandrina]|uniref:Uncharacterized protein n=1 Tax=Pocillopora meandrina TaxID=46732 RepID=A0AAU9VYC6_9CNID|nr:unnamed protein product [Pocillopora meandrina]